VTKIDSNGLGPESVRFDDSKLLSLDQVAAGQNSSTSHDPRGLELSG